MPKFKKKPITIDAVQFDGNYPSSELLFLGLNHEKIVSIGKYDKNLRTLIIHTLEGDHTASSGDWIIKGVKGELYPCKPDIFALTYEKLS